MDKVNSLINNPMIKISKAGFKSMKSYIFITSEGYTFQPGSGSYLHDIENCQVLGFGTGVDSDDAFRNFLKDNEFLLDTSFDEVRALELANNEERYFYLKNP